MDSVRADQRIAGDLNAPTRITAVEDRDHLASSILQIHQAAIDMDVRRSQPLEYSAQQHAMKLATMDAELRHRITGVDTAQFLPHGLTKPIGVDELARADARSIQRGQQAERCEFLYGVRQHIDADSEFAQFARLLVDLDVDAQVVQGKSRRETANTTSSDDYLHVTPQKKKASGTALSARQHCSLSAVPSNELDASAAHPDVGELAIVESGKLIDGVADPDFAPEPGNQASELRQPQRSSAPRKLAASNQRHQGFDACVTHALYSALVPVDVRVPHRGRP